jgi:2-hydroxycyclohexanecarboxyl-CoA dehydrogenase
MPAEGIGGRDALQG